MFHASELEPACNKSWKYRQAESTQFNPRFISVSGVPQGCSNFYRSKLHATASDCPYLQCRSSNSKEDYTCEVKQTQQRQRICAFFKTRLSCVCKMAGLILSQSLLRRPFLLNGRPLDLVQCMKIWQHLSSIAITCLNINQLMVKSQKCVMLYV